MNSLRLTIRAAVFTVVCFSTTGCSKDPFNFSQADMRAAVAGTWMGPIDSADAGTTDEIVTLVLDESAFYVGQTDAGSSSTPQSLSSRRLQCGNSRNFLGGCSGSDGPDQSTMFLTGKVSSTDGTIPTSSVSGTFIVNGSDLVEGGVELFVPGGGIVASFNAGQFGTWTYGTGAGPAVVLGLTRQ